MHDNPQALPGPAFALPDHHVIALSGRDASAFAQAQFMSDVKLLAPGRWQWSGWLTPKGRVVALFALLKFDDENLWLLLLPDADPSVLAAALQRFVFRAKVAISVRDDLHVEGMFAPPALARGNDSQGDAVRGIELDLGGDGGPRTLRVVPAPTTPPEPVQNHRWAEYDLEHGLPHLPASQAGQWTPQQLSLERLNAYSVKKGCYPGQEIVARTHFLGRAKRALALFECDGAPPTGTPVEIGAETIGEVVSQAGRVALAIVGLERRLEGALGGGIPMRVLPMASGLGR